ncbi:hypothetical protein RIR_jg42493.t1 [Rhizophagus irregularis DAOM 181602=DAOM 197198]|nr:hypothetical protein RIR_jg42493.t1 [Rhizophagus irregularis DAOM 181602=DAOM 197198]
MLYIADTFYRLNDIQINKEKSELMMRTTTEKRKYSHNYNDKISIKFGREEINIKAKHPHEPMHQIISGDKSRLLLWKEILIKAYIPVFSQRKETKWYSDIRNLITSDGVHLTLNITQLFGARVDNVEEARSYDITKKNRSLIAVYNSQFNSVVIGKIQGIDDTQRPVIKHFHIDMSRFNLQT